MKDRAKVRFANAYCDGWPLLCPWCGDLFMHHEGVEVFGHHEMNPASRFVAVGSNAKVHAQGISDRNPSLRRNGLRVYFGCETCAFEGALTIAQHKGTTYIGWEVDENVMKEIERVARELAVAAGVDPDQRMQEFGRSEWAYPAWEDFKDEAIKRIADAKNGGDAA